MTTVTTKVRLRAVKGRRRGQEPVPPRVPRVARLMALAIRFDRLIREGVVNDQAEIARLGFVTRARVTQILNLLNLSPEIQEVLLFLQAVEQGKDAVTERELREVVSTADWTMQQRIWTDLLS